MILEYDHVFVLHKPAGISVVGERHDSDIATLAGATGEWLMPGHHIDKVTSRVVLLATSIEVHGGLTCQFNQRTAGKAYLAVTAPRGLPERGAIRPLSEGRKKRVRVAAPRDSIFMDATTNRWSAPTSKETRDKRCYPSLTLFARLRIGQDRSMLALRPLTGRRHQIRVHLARIGHPIEGDQLFVKETAGVPRTSLHSLGPAFDAPWDGAIRVEVEGAPDPDLWQPLGGDAVHEAMEQPAIALHDLEAVDLEATNSARSGRKRSAHRRD